MHRNQLLWGAALVLVGVVLLMDRILHFNVWVFVAPLLLVAAGAWLIWSVLRRPGDITLEPAAVPLEGATQARIEMHHGAGRLAVGSGAEAGNLLNGTFAGGLQCRARREGDRMDVVLASRDIGPWHLGPRGLDWEVHLCPDIPLSLDLKTGADEAHLDLTGLQVTELRLATGASTTAVLLPARAGLTKVKVGAGAATVHLRVPEGVAARFTFAGGLATADVDTARFPKVGGEYRSPDYDSAANKADIEVEAGVGSVDLK